MTADDMIHVAIAAVAFFIGLAVGAGWLAERDGQAVHWPTRIINAIGTGFRFYIRMIFVGAALYAVYWLAVDIISPNRANHAAPDNQSVVQRAPAN